MSKRNLNEVLGFISRWGDSRFSSRLIDEALTSAALEKAAMMAEKDKPTSIRAKQLRTRGTKRLEDEKKLDAIISDTSLPKHTRDKAQKIRDKMTPLGDVRYQPSMSGQKKDSKTGIVTVGGVKPKLSSSNTEKAKSIAKGILSVIPLTLKGIERTAHGVSAGIDLSRNVGSMIGAPAGTINYADALRNAAVSGRTAINALTADKYYRGYRGGRRGFSDNELRRILQLKP